MIGNVLARVVNHLRTFRGNPNNDLIVQLKEARTTLSIVRTQIMVEVNRGVVRWEGVPDRLKERIDEIDRRITKVSGV